MPCSQCVLSGFAIKRFGDLVHGFGIGLGTGHPLGAHGHGLHSGHIFVGACGNRIDRQIRIGLAQSLCLRTCQGHQLDARATGSQLGNRPSRRTAHKEEGIECPVLELVTGLVRLDVLGLDVAFFHAISSQHDAGIDQGSRAWLVQRHALALEVSHRLDARAFFDHQVNALGVQVGDHAQVGHLGLAFVNAGAGIGPCGHIGLRKARLHRTTCHTVHVGHRAVGCLCRGHDLAGLADRVGDHAAHGVVSTSGTAGADAKKLLCLHRRRHGGGQTQDPKQIATLHVMPH